MSQHTSDNDQTTQYTNALNNSGIIQLTGEEKTSYLQGQVTADINKLTDNNTLLGCHCDFKGKMWSVFYALTWQDSILLLTDNSVLEKSLSELNKYGVFAKVEITNQSEKWQVMGGSGSVFEKAATALFDDLPSRDRQVLSNENGLIISIEHPTQRYIVLQPKSTQKRLICDITPNEQLWEVENIKAGLGKIQQMTINEYVPQMLNLQALNAIDFEKGCYMGQEVIARTKYLGRNKRAGFILKSDSQCIDLSGELLEYQIDENWRPGGKILNCGVSSGQTWIFAVLSIETQIGSSFRLKSSPNVIFVTQVLPYTLQ